MRGEFCADHPVIRNLERTGYPDGRPPAVPVCPLCGEEAERFYYDRNGELVGCDECVSARDAWEVMECGVD